MQGLIADDPSSLALAISCCGTRNVFNLVPGGLTFSCKDSETRRRYEVEVQLGATDEAHIIRTIEYWDIERKRYPQYDHCAVLIAEDITSRFLNVISLFNGTIPMIAIQMQALKVGDHTTLVFTKVMDELSRGLVDEDEDAEAAPSDRTYWENRASKSTVQLADDLLSIAKSFDSSLALKYNRFYIGLAKDGLAYNFIQFRPRKTTINLELKLPRSEETDKLIDDAGIETLDYIARWGQYRLTLRKDDIVKIARSTVATHQRGLSE